MRELLRRLRVWLVYSWSSLEFDHGSWETSFFTWWAASRQTKSDNDSVCPDTDTVLGMYVLRNEDMYQTMQSSFLNLGSCLASQQSYWAGSCLTFICHLSLQVESACCKVQQVWARGLELGHDRKKDASQWPVLSMSYLSVLVRFLPRTRFITQQHCSRAPWHPAPTLSSPDSAQATLVVCRISFSLLNWFLPSICLSPPFSGSLDKECWLLWQWTG